MRDIIANDFVRIAGGRIICGKTNEILNNFKKDTREIMKR